MTVNAALANLNVTRENNANLRSDAQQHVDAILAGLNGLQDNLAVAGLESKGLLRRPQAQKLESIESKIAEASDHFANATQIREEVTKAVDKQKEFLEDIANVKPKRQPLILKSKSQRLILWLTASCKIISEGYFYLFRVFNGMGQVVRGGQDSGYRRRFQ